MATTAQTPAADVGAGPSRSLFPRLRVLFITTFTRPGGWLTEAFVAECGSEVDLEEAIGEAAGLARLRDEQFDAVLLSHVPGELDALAFLEGMRAGGSDEPVLVLGTGSEQEMLPSCYQLGADAYLCVNTVTAATLFWLAARAIERCQLAREHRRLKQAERQRLERERSEAQQLLAELHSSLVAPMDGEDPPAAMFPAELVAHYRDLLRAYVIMGSGHLGEEVGALGEMLASAGFSSRQAMQLHLHVLGEIISGLGNRSSRHVMTRADVLGLEMTVHLAESYRRRYVDRATPPQQMTLPGF